MTMRSLMGAVALAVIAAGFAEAQPGPPPPGTPIDLSRLGPQPGQQVPDFRLRDQNGREWTRNSIMGPKGAMLVFFRSADW